MSELLDDLLARVNAMTPEEQAKAQAQAQAVIGSKKWIPNPGPQTDAYFCEADELFYGGEAGGGKSQLLLGLALNEHQNSLILRRYTDDARDLADFMVHIVGNDDGLNRQLLDWRIPNTTQRVEFAGCQHEHDKQRFKGDPHDLIAFDEIADFTESQFDFIITWNRSVNPKQRCRVVGAGNPPTAIEGLWVIRRWAPWLDPTFPKPAKSGEVRWYYRDHDDVEHWVDAPGKYDDGTGRLVSARSRCFIRSRLSDNPQLSATDYDRTLDNLPKEIRAAYRDGNFESGLKDQERQIIPTAWVRAAQQRWRPHAPDGMPMTGIGVDIAQGGADQTVLSPRYDGWFAKLDVHPGSDTPSGREVAGLVVGIRRSNAMVTIDMGGGYGGETYNLLKDNIDDRRLVRFKGAEATALRTNDRTYGFVNCRTAALWIFREALDPDQEHGSPISLPPDQELLADLCAATFRLTPRGIEAEPADKVKERLGRSPDKGVAVLMSWWAGEKYPHQVMSGLGGRNGRNRGMTAHGAPSGGRPGEKPWGW